MVGDSSAITRWAFAVRPLNPRIEVAAGAKVPKRPGAVARRFQRCSGQPLGVIPIAYVVADIEVFTAWARLGAAYRFVLNREKGFSDRHWSVVIFVAGRACGRLVSLGRGESAADRPRFFFHRGRFVLRGQGHHFSAGIGDKDGVFKLRRERTVAA